MIKAFVSGVCCVALLLLGGRVCAQERATRLGLDEAVDRVLDSYNRRGTGMPAAPAKADAQ